VSIFFRAVAMAEKTVELKPPFTIKVKTRESQVKEVDVDEGWLISRLKGELEKVTGVPVSSQRLIYMGKVLRDDDPIREYGIKAGDTLHMVKKPVSDGPDSHQPGDELGEQTMATFAHNLQTPNIQTQLMAGAFALPEGQADMGSIFRSVLSGFGGNGPQAIHIQTTPTAVHLGGSQPFMFLPGPAGSGASSPTGNPFSTVPPPTVNLNALPSSSSSSSPSQPSSAPPAPEGPFPAQQPFPMNFFPMMISQPPRPFIASVNLHIHATPAELDQLPARLDRLGQQMSFQNMAPSATNPNSWRQTTLHGFPTEFNHPLFSSFPTPMPHADRPHPAAGPPVPPPPLNFAPPAPPVPHPPGSHPTTSPNRRPDAVPPTPTPSTPTPPAVVVATTPGTVLQPGGQSMVGGLLQALGNAFTSGVQQSVAARSTALTGAPAETPSSFEVLCSRLMNLLAFADVTAVLGGDYTPFDKVEGPIREFLVAEIERLVAITRDPSGAVNAQVWAAKIAQRLVGELEGAEPMQTAMRTHMIRREGYFEELREELTARLADFSGLVIVGMQRRQPPPSFNAVVRRWWTAAAGAIVQALVDRCQGSEAGARVLVETMANVILYANAQRDHRFAPIAIIGSPMLASFIFNAFEEHRRSASSSSTPAAAATAAESASPAPPTPDPSGPSTPEPQ
jgi:hypothetical protein